MISDSQLKELKTYRDLERGLLLEMRPTWGPLVVAADNELMPIHRWFRFKEAYSASLLPTILNTTDSPNAPKTILDPYCGVGTTLLSAQLLTGPKLKATGIEYNPFIRFVASTKIQWNMIDPSEMLRLATKAVDCPPADVGAIPRLSGLTTGRCMSKFIARRLVGIRDTINQERPSPTRQALLLGLAAAIEPLSHTRKDGRALRLVTRARQSISRILMSKWRMIATDVDQMRKESGCLNAAEVLEGDGRSPLEHGIEPNSIDLIITSPPYPNNIDYSEVYKLELWMLGFVRDSGEFLRLRKGTLRSHPTSELSGSQEAFLKRLKTGRLLGAFEPILSRTDTDNEKWRRRLFIAYFSDLSSSLRQYFAVLKPRGRAFITVGNSLHGGKYAPYLVATDLLIAELARSHGFLVEEISIARSLKRRLSGNHFLRESIVVLRKG